MGMKVGPAPSLGELKIYCFWTINPTIPIHTPRFFIAKCKSDAIRMAAFFEQFHNEADTLENKINFDYEDISEYPIREGGILENSMNSMIAEIIFKKK